MSLLILAELAGLGTTVLATAGIVFVVFVFTAVWASRYTKVGPNEVLIISGRQHRYADGEGKSTVRGFRIVKGGGTFIIPVVEKADILSLELLTIDVQTPEV
jgi:flotillin